MAPTAAAFAPKLSQVLMTPEPHFLPGYGGYCPRYKFTLGQTYGKLTSQLLAAPSRSGRLLLQPNCALCAPKERPGPGRRARGKGCSGVPGYTGFVPRAQHHFAKTYGEICKQAWLEFAPQQELGGGGQAREVTETPQLESRPLPALPTAETDAAAAPLAFWPPGTPLAGSLERTFVSGFTGFVPRLQFLIGASYPILAHQAMVEFDEMLHKTGRDSSQRGDSLPPLAKTYPTDRGLLPHYRGYVPGYKFQFGHTYGHLTRNALGQTTLEKQVLDVTQ
ncbi:protein FAM166B isoform X2 [Ahaetulla prasina]|uniref:protein FAM166B isoform X2 n=1 Tax=Ahaetulla prasina TaxID=499056 RepID=UPI0026478D8A|nr:protein FAM166B isoform X2 [Ahaetulla prasina]